MLGGAARSSPRGDDQERASDNDPETSAASSRPTVSRIEGEIRIGRPVEEVFDFVADAAPGVKEILSTHYPEHIEPAVDAKIRERFPIRLDRADMRPGNGRW